MFCSSSELKARAHIDYYIICLPPDLIIQIYQYIVFSLNNYICTVPYNCLDKLHIGAFPFQQTMIYLVQPLTRTGHRQSANAIYILYCYILTFFEGFRFLHNILCLQFGVRLDPIMANSFSTKVQTLGHLLARHVMIERFRNST